MGSPARGGEVVKALAPDGQKFADYAGLKWRHDPRLWDVVSALAPDDDYAFEASVLGSVPCRTDPVTGDVSGLITEEMQAAAKAHGFLILAAIPFRNVYVIKRWRPGAALRGEVKP